MRAKTAMVMALSGGAAGGELAMPRMMYGTAWKKERTRELVLAALGAGFRGIDTACQPKHYNEPAVGEALEEAIRSGVVDRQSVFVQTKFTPLAGQDERVPYDASAALGEQVRSSFETSLRNLRTTYVDCLVLHSPLPTHEETLEAWRAMETIHRDGRARQLGVSNCYALDEIRWLHDAAEVKPSVVQNRFYAATGWDRDLRAWAQAKGVRHQSFWTLTANPKAIDSPPVREVAHRLGVSGAQLFFRFVLQLGITPLTGTSSRAHMCDDLAVLGMRELSADDMAAVADALERCYPRPASASA
ncbi:hypothetical protein KFE25_002046 [Diacronema lutheri]|uniref:NADP-dependent oxidoreductase domain-containing protein n=2 Tax=Diacronema lutheri TaxID=2081491 RepID=A0A8J5XQZ4_DIALT|nr:hypothetical protein KFE25_002046 [Diacronema lutheri]